MSQPAQEVFSVEGLLELYARQDWDELSLRLLRSLAAFGLLKISVLDAQAQYRLDRFVQHFLFVFSQPDYVIPVTHRAGFVQSNSVISNLVAISSTRTTDAYLPLIVGHDNLVKLMALYSARNHSRLHAKQFFDVNPQAASIWYWHFLRVFPSALADENAYLHLRYQLADPDPRLQADLICCDGFFGSTYINSQTDMHLKRRLNQALRADFESTGVSLAPSSGSRRLGVVTGTWREGHSVYRNHFDMVAALKDDYELVLLNTARPEVKLADTGLFQEVLDVRLQANGLPLADLIRQNFAVLYFTDIGLTAESLLLANCRLAPLQMTSYGHSVSTFGADIDYYIASETVEDLDLLQENYSERVVLLPGLGVTNVRPNYTEVEPVRRSDRVVISCSWYGQKVNPPLLRALEAVLERCPPQSVLFRFFPGGLPQGHFLPFAQSICESLGPENVEVCPPMPYQQYMEAMNQGHFALEPFPFGGCNTIVDSLHLRQPIVVCQGKRWYSRVGSAILKEAGLSELVTQNSQQYIDKIVQLVEDPDYLAGLRRRLQSLDLDELLYSKNYAHQFKAAVDYLYAEHPRLAASGSREPVRIPAL